MGMIIEAEILAKSWMPGMREGTTRHAWEHPRDLVRILRASPIKAVDDHTLTVAWLHDIVEDGKKEDGSPVSLLDLKDFPLEVVSDVKSLTNFGTQKIDYLMSLSKLTPRAKLVKCADRICNLHDGAHVFKKPRWIRYLGETYYFIYPLAKDLEPLGFEAVAWAQTELINAAQLRRL